MVVVHLLNGKRQIKLVKLNRGGDGRKKVAFDNRKVGAVSVTLVNGSTRYRCNKRHGARLRRQAARRQGALRRQGERRQALMITR